MSACACVCVRVCGCVYTGMVTSVSVQSSLHAECVQKYRAHSVGDGDV